MQVGRTGFYDDEEEGGNSFFLVDEGAQSWEHGRWRAGRTGGS